jgi:hypothetical protein
MILILFRYVILLYILLYIDQNWFISNNSSHTWKMHIHDMVFCKILMTRVISMLISLWCEYFS